MKNFQKTLTLATLLFFSLLAASIFLPTVTYAAGETYSFTNAGATGNTGPTQAQINTAYSSTNLNGRVTINTQGVQEWRVPTSGEYSVTAAGAAGGSNLNGNFTGGGGAVLTTKLSLTQDTILKIVVGQKGSDNPAICATSYCAGAGGGGSFVYESSTTTYLVAAGGGGGGASISSNLTSTKTMADGKANSTSGSSTSSGAPCTVYTATGGTGGAGGGISSRGAVNIAGPGAGINSDGASAGSAEGKSRLGGWLGGLMSRAPTLAGGFGGGGAAGTWTNGNYYWAGGGGGYSGGGGGFNAGCGDGQYGGGGGSYYSGTLENSSNGSNTGHGYVTITLLTQPVVTFSTPSSLTFRRSSTLTVNADSAGRITFLANGKTIAKCVKVNLVGSGNSYFANCAWSPSGRGQVRLEANYLASGSSQVSVRTSITVNVSHRKTYR